VSNKLLSSPHSLHSSFEDHSNEFQMCVNIHFMLMNSPDCSTCLFSWYGLLIIMVGGVGTVGGDFSQTPQTPLGTLPLNPAGGLVPDPSFILAKFPATPPCDTIRLVEWAGPLPNNLIPHPKNEPKKPPADFSFLSACDIKSIAFCSWSTILVVSNETYNITAYVKMFITICVILGRDHN